MNQSPEEWKPIVGFESRYEVSDRGRVRSFVSRDPAGGPRILKPRPGSNGYSRAHLTKGGKAHDRPVHRLVMAAFVGPCPATLEVNHIDGDKANNLLTNLEYVTRSENQIHAFRIGLNPGRGRSNPGSTNGQARLNEADIPVIRDLSRTVSNPAIAERFRVSIATIQRVTSRSAWKHVL